MVTPEVTSPSEMKISKRLSPTLAEDGFAAVPRVFLEQYHTFDLSSSEAMLVIHLLNYKWTEKRPFPKVATIAERMGMTETAVRSHARSLEKKHLLKRIARAGQSNEFDLEPLFRRLEFLLAKSPRKAKKTPDTENEGTL